MLKPLFIQPLLVLCTLGANLVLGNFILIHINKETPWPQAMLCLSAATVLLLLTGFGRIRADSGTLKTALTGVLVTVSTAPAGFFLLGIAETANSLAALPAAVGKGLAGAVVFGVMGGIMFSIPFLPINIFAYCLYRRRLIVKARLPIINGRRDHAETC